jgi:ribonuclease HI
MLQIYIDGAYKSSIDQGGIGIVWMKDDKVFKKYSKGFKHTTNNKMELIAMLCAFKSIKTPMDEVEFTNSSSGV